MTTFHHTNRIWNDLKLKLNFFLKIILFHKGFYVCTHNKTDLNADNYCLRKSEKKIESKPK